MEDVLPDREFVTLMMILHRQLTFPASLSSVQHNNRTSSFIMTRVHPIALSKPCVCVLIREMVQRLKESFLFKIFVSFFLGLLALKLHKILVIVSIGIVG